MVPPAIRAPRIVHSPIPEDDPPDKPTAQLLLEAVVELEPVAEVTTGVDDKPGRKRTRSRSSRKQEDFVVPKASLSSPRRQVLTLTVPPLTTAATDTDITQPLPPPPEDEPRYCYCNDISSGYVSTFKFNHICRD